MKKFTIISIIFLIFLALIGGGMMWYAKNQKPVNPPLTENRQIATTTKSVATSTSEIDTSNWLTYRNEEYGFEVKYPENWEIKIDNNRLFFVDQKHYENFQDWTEMSIEFLDNVDSLEAKILEPFKDVGYKSIREFVEKNDDVFSYSTTTIGTLLIPTLSAGAETQYDNYYLLSKRKNKSYIKIQIVFIHPMKNKILHTIKIY